MKLKFFCFITLLFTAIFLSGAELQTAIARGIGSTSDAALKDALNQAVQQVVGSMVSSEAFVKNIGELSKQGRLLAERIERFLKNFNALQERINALQKTFDDSKKALSDGTQSVANTALRFHELSLKALDNETKKIEVETENE